MGGYKLGYGNVDKEQIALAVGNSSVPHSVTECNL